MIKNNIINLNEKLREEERGERKKKAFNMLVQQLSHASFFSFTYNGGVV